jgi:hypothetical protein
MKIRSFFVLSLASLALVMPAAPVSAGLVPTEGVVPVSPERERVKDLVSRPDVAKKLEALGVLPKDAASRVDALTEDEVRALAARIDALPAGGLSNQEWLIIIIIVVLIAIAL